MLLNAEIRYKEKHVKKLCKSLLEQTTYFKQSVKTIDYVKYKTTILETINRVKTEWYSTHRRKFTNLRAGTRLDAGLLDPDSVITNLSDHTLTEVEKFTLANGLKFSLPPSKLKTGSYLAIFELLYNDLSKFSFSGNEEDEVYL